KKQYELEQKQADIQKTAAEAAKLQAEQTKLLVEAQAATRKEDAALVTMIVDLIFKQAQQCRTEDQAVMFEFLVEMNDQYNTVKLGRTGIAGAFKKRHECEDQNPAIIADARPAKEAGNGQIQQVAESNIKAVLEALLKKKEFKSAAPNLGQTGANGYIALGRA